MNQFRRDLLPHSWANTNTRTHLVRSDGTELDVLFLERATIQHRLHAITRAWPRLMVFDDYWHTFGCSCFSVAGIRIFTYLIYNQSVYTSSHCTTIQLSTGLTDIIAIDSLLEVSVVDNFLLELPYLSCHPWQPPERKSGPWVNDSNIGSCQLIWCEQDCKSWQLRGSWSGLGSK